MGEWGVFLGGEMKEKEIESAPGEGVNDGTRMDGEIR